MTRRWTTLDGLHENVVTALSRSSDGYLWVTTPLGVARFDGVKFTTYLPPDLPEVPPPATNAVALPRLPGRKVLCALAESNGVVWVGTDGDGLLRLRPRLVSLRHEAPATNGVVRFTDSTGRVWSGTSADGIRVVLRDGTERHFGTQDGFDARQVTSFAETPDGSVWVGSDGAGGRSRRSPKRRTEASGSVPTARVSGASLATRSAAILATTGKGTILYERSSATARARSG